MNAPAPTIESHSEATRASTQAVSDTLVARLRRWRPFLLAAAVLLILAVVTTLLGPRYSDVPYAIDNVNDDGAQALARLLRDEGISVEKADSAEGAARTAAAGTTVAVLNAGQLTEDERAALTAHGGDVVVVGTLYQDLSGLGGFSSSGQSASAETPIAAQCSDADAVSAGSVAGSRGSVQLDDTPGAIGCFPLPGGTYAYATAPTAAEGELRIIADPSIVTNSRLTEAGHAALAVRALGRNPHLVWFDASQQSGSSSGGSATMPPWLSVLMLQGAVIVCALAVVQGRRFGRLVVEDLPVVVRSTETTFGRGRLYRRAKARAHAAEALRTATALRLARVLGLPPGADLDSIIHAAARASDWRPRLISEILRGPVPSNDQSLADLAVQLDRLESEVLSR